MKEIYKLLKENELSGIPLNNYHKGEIIYSENDECKSVGIIKKGKIRIASYLENGKEVIYNSLEKGAMFGNNLIFSSNPIYRGDVIAEEETEIYEITKDKLKLILKNNDDFLEQYLRAQSEFVKKINLQVKLLTFNNANDRVLYLLEVNNGELAYKSISKLAKELFLTREVTSRTIHKLAKDRVVKIENKSIIKI